MNVTQPWPRKLALPDEAATIALGRQLALKLKPGDVVALSGELGTGKTTLARSLIQHLMQAEFPVPSPTFTLVQHYNAPNQCVIAHYDWYRLRVPDEVLELGFEEDCDTAITLVEWPERAARFLPARALHIKLTHDIGTGRSALLHGSASWAARLQFDLS